MNHVHDLAHHSGSLTLALIAGFFVALSGGLMGPIVLASRTSAMAGAISHSVLAGVGVAFYFQFQSELGAFWAAMIAAVIIGYVTLKWPRHKGMIMNGVWSLGMAIGVILLAAKGENGDEILHFLFGDILHISKPDIYFSAAGFALLLFLVIYLYRSLLIVIFDREQAEVQGVPARSLYLFIMCMIAFAIVMLVKLVGVILVLALLSLPAAIASHYSKFLKQQIVYSCVIAVFLTEAGLLLANRLGWPSGAVIALISSLCFLFVLIISGIKFKKT